jgi:hypothetical protein
MDLFLYIGAGRAGFQILGITPETIVELTTHVRTGAGDEKQVWGVNI